MQQDILYSSRILMIEAGLPACFSVYAQPCFCFNDNISETEDAPGITPYYKRHKKHDG